MGIDYNNYIHLKYYNYLLESRETPETVFDNTKNMVLRNLKKGSINETERAQLENQLNYFYSGLRGESGVVNGQMSQEAANKIMEGAIKYVQQHNPDKHVSVTSTLRGGTGRYDSLYTNRVEHLSKTVKHRTSTIEKHMRVLQSIKESTTNKNLIANIQRLEQQWSLLNQTKIDYNGKNYQRFIKDYNRLVDQIFTRDSKIQGDLGEAIVAAIMLMYDCGIDNFMALSSNDIANMLTTSNNKVVGAETSFKGFIVDNVLPTQLRGSDLTDLLPDMNLSTLQYNGEEVQVAYNKNPTQNKVDVVFTLKNKPVNVSVKNYDLSNYYTQQHGIGIVSGTNPLILLNNDGNFLRHYLNVTAEHGYYEDEKNNIASGLLEPSYSTLEEAHRVIKMLMFARGLMGGQLQKNLGAQGAEAELFIINDVSSGRFKVFLIQDLINKVIDNYALAHVSKEVKIDGEIIEGYPSDPLHKYNINGWENMSPNERIRHIYQQILRQHIYIHLDYSII